MQHMRLFSVALKCWELATKSGERSEAADE